ncbi:MAG: DUF2799 domain-containing protein [Bdellovibrionales bacterium]|nr:DUF2799 domain-containing protein [Bdellovibrionales bacterium]
MTSTKLFARLLPIAAFLVSCASPTKQECLDMNWQKMGAKQGSEGRAFDQKIAEMKKSCDDRHGIAVNRAEFMNGYRLGLQRYCSFSRGERMGQQGQRFNPPSVCTQKLVPVMKAGYDKGLKSYCMPSRFRGDGERGEIFSYSAVCPKAGEKQALSFYNQGLMVNCQKQFVQMGRKGQKFEVGGLCSTLKQDSKLRRMYDTGNKIYCTKDIGYEVGLSGKKYNFVCKKPAEHDFLAGYNMGAQQKAQNDIRELSNELHQLRQENADKALQIQTLSSRVNYLEREVGDLEEEVEDREDEIERLKKKTRTQY